MFFLTLEPQHKVSPTPAGHIYASSMTAIPIAQASLSLSSEPPAAYRIPSEILDEIVLQVCSLYDDAVDRAPLRPLCLVSRRWAEIARPEVWHSVVIVSAVHLRSLCSLLDAPPPRSMTALPYLMHLLVCAIDFLDRSQPPWLHLVHPQLAPRIKYPTRASLDVVHEGVLQNLRTIHPCLPRTIPSCFAPIRTLWLSRAEFKTRTAELYLLNSLVHLRSLVCRGISWKSDELPAASLVLRSTLHTIWVDDPSDTQTDDEAGMRVWWLLPAVFGSCLRPNSRTVRAREGAPALPEADFRVLVGMVAALQSGRRLNRFRLKLFPVRSQSHGVYIIQDLAELVNEVCI